MTSRITRSNGRKLSSASSTTRSKSATSKSQAPTSQQGPAPSGKKRASSSKAQESQDVWCTCRKQDDGTPMIRCESCADWFHFSCIQLSEYEAEDIRLYICDACHEKTKLSTVYEWDGPETVQTVRGALRSKDGDDKDIKTTSQRRTRSVSALPPDSSDDEDVASGDDYKEEGVAQEDITVIRRKGAKRIAFSDEDGSDSDDDGLPRRNPRMKRKRVSKETQQRRKRPRKSSTAEISDSEEEKPSRRLKKGSPQAKDHPDSSLDATRKYCLTKLQEVLKPIFLQFARDTDPLTEPAELGEEEKHAAEEKAVNYCQELERCLYDAYGEIDKNGHKAAVGKYKDRFRMLTFNLSQTDRYHLRKSIGTHSLPAVELSKMSSVDLANEQIKQRIEAANRESLQHSILTERPTLPRAKITHKGEEIIEDIEGFDIGKRLREEELLEREREREKATREKAATKAATVSPVSPVRPSYGPQDILAQQHNVASQMAAQALAEQTAVLAQTNTTVDTPTEPTFKFDDLIAIDLPDSPSQGPAELPTVGETTPVDKKVDKEPTTEPQAQVQQREPISPTATFDLNNVWSANESTPQESSGSPIISARADDGHGPPQIDVDLGTAAHDEDFDMFLAENEPLSAAVLSGPEQEKAAFENLPIIWSGSILMPDLEKCPKVQARQVGGRPIDSTSPQWKVLFPAPSPPQLRIEGRVPVNDSAKYMTQNRLNVSRELIVVAFTPADERKEYDELLSALINRTRHAVIHPWGSRPSPDAPGKELYLVPVIANQPLPDYIELLDLVKFPKQADENRLLGVFILNKGKFSVPVHSQPPPSSSLSPPPPTTLPSLLTNLAATLPPPMPAIPSIPPSSNLSQNSALNPDLVSKLSSEQIESLLQSVLASNGGSLPTSFSVSTPAVSAPFATPLPPAIASLLQAQSQHSPPHPPYPYPPVQPGPLPPPGSYGFGSHTDPAVERDSNKPISPYGAYNDRGDRGRGRGRGFDKTRDTGWGGRGRGRGRGGGGGQYTRS